MSPHLIAESPQEQTVGRRRSNSMAFQEPMPSSMSPQGSDREMEYRQPRDFEFNAYSAKSAPLLGNQSAMQGRSSVQYNQGLPMRNSCGLHGTNSPSHMSVAQASSGGHGTGCTSPQQSGGWEQEHDERVASENRILLERAGVKMKGVAEQTVIARGFQTGYELSFKRLRSSEPGFEEGGSISGDYGHGASVDRHSDHSGVKSGGILGMIPTGGISVPINNSSAQAKSSLSGHSSASLPGRLSRGQQSSGHASPYRSLAPISALPVDQSQPQGQGPQGGLDSSRQLLHDLPSFNMNLSPSNSFGQLNGSFNRAPVNIEQAAQAALAEHQHLNSSDLSLNPAQLLQSEGPSLYRQQQQQQHMLRSLQGEKSAEAGDITLSPPDVSSLRLGERGLQLDNASDSLLEPESESFKRLLEGSLYLPNGADGTAFDPAVMMDGEGGGNRQQ
eukprot:gene31495-6682_t